MSIGFRLLRAGNAPKATRESEFLRREALEALNLEADKYDHKIGDQGFGAKAIALANEHAERRRKRGW